MNEQEACNTSAEESLDVEDEYIDHDYMNLAPKHICTMWCGSDFKSMIILWMPQDELREELMVMR